MGMRESDRRRYKEFLDAELEAAAMYASMAKAEENAAKAEIFEQLVESELRHARRWAEKLGVEDAEPIQPKVNLRVRLFQLALGVLGVKRVLPWLIRVEAKEIDAYDYEPGAEDMADEERKHARTLRRLDSGEEGAAGWELRRSSATDGGGLRAAVLGVNDGLVSNFSLVMGVAGGSGNPDIVLLAGLAGLLAGAFSMAAGEYVSMRSQRDVYERSIRVERAELEAWPEEEEQELVLIYRAKGLSQEEAERFAKRIMERPAVALDTMVREELGLDPHQLGSPWQAALSSFAAFVVGALVPILAYLFDTGVSAFVLSTAMSAGALVIVGGALGLFSGNNPAWGALRMLALGCAAAGVTYGIGRLIGVTVMG